MPDSRSRVNDPAVVRREYASEAKFLARRLANRAELIGPLVEDAAIAAVAEGAPGLALDVGCGTGDFSARIPQELGVELIALDISPRMATLAHARGLPATTADLESLPIPDGAFDCVIANRVLYHLPDLARGLAEIARILRPGGRLVVVTYGSEHLSELWDLVGVWPQRSSPFSAENGTAALERHFSRVERRDIAGIARYASRDAILEHLAAWGEFAESDYGARIGDVPTPFDATYRHCVFVAQSSTIEASWPRY